MLEQEVSLFQVIQVLLDREEDAKNVCRLDHLPSYADGLCACVQMDDVFSSFAKESALLEDSCAKNDWVTMFFMCVKNPFGFVVFPVFFEPGPTKIQ